MCACLGATDRRMFLCDCMHPCTDHQLGEEAAVQEEAGEVVAPLVVLLRRAQEGVGLWCVCGGGVG